MKKILLLLTAFALLGPARAATYTIYPIPQQLQEGTETVSLTATVDVVCESGIDGYTRTRLTGILSDHGLKANYTSTPSASGRSVIYLGVNGSGQTTDLLATTRGLSRDVLTLDGKFDRHILSLSSQGGQAELIVIGEHTDAVFFGLASLEQMLDNGTSGLTTVTICDYADQQSRGLVEGYYGYPYSVSVKKDLLRFMMRYKMNTYLYGAKSDPYHSEKWKDAYPTSITAQQETNGWLSQQMIKEITQESQETKVNFIWAIHPGGNFISSSTVVDDIIGKFQKMYTLGVRQFGIFVDDVGLPSADNYELNASRLTQVQQRLEALYNTEGAAPADTVKPLHFVPQAYAAGFVNDTEREGFFTALAATPANITIYTTGWGVWSIPNSSDLYAISKFLGRNVAWWWNYPCNDNADGQVYTMDMYSNFYDLPAVNSSGTVPADLQNGAGIVSNPMQEGELSKVALFSVADYAWNTDGFSVKPSWRAAVRAVVGDEAYDDYIFLADYLRYNDPADFNTLMENVKTGLTSGTLDATVLQERLQHITKACDTFIAFKDSERESDRLLYNDIEPWLLKLRQMAQACLSLLDVAQMDDTAEDKWQQYVGSLNLLDDISTNDDYVAYALEGMGSGISVSSRISQPSHRYFNSFLTYLKERVMAKYFGTASTKLTVITNAAASNPLKPKTTGGYFTMTASRDLTLQQGEYVGLSLPYSTQLDDLFIGDNLLSFTILYSANGKEWNTYNAADGLPTGYVKYVVFLNQTGETQTLRPIAKYFRVVPATTPAVSSVSVPSGGNANSTTPDNLTDGDYTTWFSVNRCQQTDDAYTLTLADTAIVRDVRICVGTTNGDYMNAGRVEVSLDGNSWTALKVKGTSVINFNLSLSQVVTYSDNMKYCDFDGGSRKARYVRFRITNPNTSRWMRLFEIEVNKHSGLMPLAVDNNGEEVSALTDRKAYTGSPADVTNLYYRFVQLHPLRSVTLYQDGGNGTDAAAYVTTDGSSWTKLGNLTGYICTFDLTDYPTATQLRIYWKNTAPAIYEILEETDDTSELVPTGIAAPSEALQPIDGGSVSRMEVFDTSGRSLYQGKFAPLSRCASRSQVVVAKYHLTNGKVLVRKFVVR